MSTRLTAASEGLAHADRIQQRVDANGGPHVRIPVRVVCGDVAGGAARSLQGSSLHNGSTGLDRSLPTLHILGIPHTETTAHYSHCAFTGKVLRFPKMMRALGYSVVHYGAGPQAPEGTTEHVVLMSRAEQAELRGHDGSDPAKFVGDDAVVGSPLYREFNSRLRAALYDHVAVRDLILLPFGHAHAAALDGFPSVPMVETGIGYPTLYAGAPFKVFESYAWMHRHQGIAGREGSAYEWVAPNYFDLADWDVDLEGDPETVVFLGRIGETKGLPTLVAVAKSMPDLRFVICGQGDPEPWVKQSHNIFYRPPLAGRERSAFLGRARCLLLPSHFIEPFGGAAVEAQLCGTPAVTPDNGAFPETIEQGRSGFHCHTLGDYVAAIRAAVGLDRLYVANRARSRYSLEAVGPMYDRIFRQIVDLRGAGWYSLRSHLLGKKSHIHMQTA